ncbi:MAG: hypothetical protein Q4B59_03490 [Lachnospiraceae bacterium]|nr:hypothetical protein [Lachnospiraceae bacterium]
MSRTSKGTDLVAAPGIFEGFRPRTSGEGITFTLVCDPQAEASVVLYKKGSEQILAELPVQPQSEYGYVRCLKVSGAQAATLEYNYRIDGEIVTDPAAPLVVGRAPFGETKTRRPHQIRGGFILDTFAWDPNEKKPALKEEEIVAYRLHVRGYTRHKNSGVSKKGTYRALMEKIPYLQELGINQVILMPVWEFEEMIEPETGADEITQAYRSRTEAEGKKHRSMQMPPACTQSVNYWGYTKHWCFAPKSGYAAGRQPDVEFREMVQAFHLAGMEVIVDAAFTGAEPIRLVQECLQWWIDTYHVDGFHLLTDNDKIRALASDPLFGRTRLLAGYFDGDLVEKGAAGSGRPGAGEGRMKGRGRYLTDCNSGFLEDARRMLKGDENRLEAFAARMKGNGRSTVNYITGHDGFTLADLVSYNDRHNEDNGESNRDGTDCNFSWNCGEEGPSRKKATQELRLRQSKNALTMLMMARDIPMLLAGDELGNSQNGNNNPWCQDNEVSWIDWGKTRNGRALLEYTKELIAIRRRFVGVRKSRGTAIRTNGGFPAFSVHGTRAWYGGFEYQNRHIGMMQCAPGEEGENGCLYTAFNCHWDSQVLALPYLPEGLEWKLLLTSDPKLEEQLAGQPLEKELVLPGRTTCILAAEAVQPKERKRAGAEACKDREAKAPAEVPVKPTGKSAAGPDENMKQEKA